MLYIVRHAHESASHKDFKVSLDHSYSKFLDTNSNIVREKIFSRINDSIDGLVALPKVLIPHPNLIFISTVRSNIVAFDRRRLQLQDRTLASSICDQNANRNIKSGRHRRPGNLFLIRQPIQAPPSLTDDPFRQMLIGSATFAQAKVAHDYRVCPPVWNKPAGTSAPRCGRCLRLRSIGHSP